jgi:hypothetical protein
MQKRGTFSYRLGALSQCLNSFVGRGNRDQTFSARCWEGELYKFKKWIILRKFVDLIFHLFEKKHCENSYETDKELTYRD